MPTEIKIRWEGTAPGLPEGRLSLSAFGEPLNNFLSALRRIASNMVSQAVEEKTKGRLASAAKQIDIEITELVKASSGVETMVTWVPPIGMTHPLFSDLPERAATELFDAIDAERQGSVRNTAVRNYLSSLPQGISKQSYSLSRDGKQLRDISFGIADLADTTVDLPYLKKRSGRVVGVGFEPGKTEIRVQTIDGVERMAATAKQVESALELRTAIIEITTVVIGGSQKLLALHSTHDSAPPPKREAAIYERWNDLLQRLAK